MARIGSAPLLVLLTSAAAACGSGVEERAPAAAAPEPAPVRARAGAEAEAPAVLVELFTSQGCSSCPPADRLLPHLEEELPGGPIIALAFHVDYWDDLGWRDPFSHPAWSARQRRYARHLPDGRVYTPQLVIAGREHAVGSVRRKVRRALERARQAAAAGPRAAVSGRGRDAADRIIVSLEASSERDATAWVALVEDDLSTPVTRGENQGRALINHAVVRRLVEGPRLTPGAPGRAELALPIDPSWRRDRLGLVAFVQDPTAMHVLAAARLPLARAP